jgi:hypothetical protein
VVTHQACCLSRSLQRDLSPFLPSGDAWATAAAALRQVPRYSSGSSPAMSTHQVCPPLPAARNGTPEP